jgi:threonine/homoserine/homoserine lactone efflux protein
MMPSLPTIALFLLATFVFAVIPGPAVLYIVTRGVAQGRRAGLASALGIGAGTLTHVAAAALGLSVLLATSALAFTVVKYLGAAYLFFLGIRTLLARGDDQPAIVTMPRRTTQLFAQGFVVQLLNPKTALFFYAFLPQFVDPAKGSASEQIAVLGALSVLLVLCTDSAYGVLAGTAGRWLQRHAGVRWARRYLTGSVYIGLGMSTALAGAEHK